MKAIVMTLSNPIIRIIKLFYNEQFESYCTRLLYFFNTLNSFYLFSGITSFVLFQLYHGQTLMLPLSTLGIMAVSTVVLFVILRVADFYPAYLILNLPGLTYLMINGTPGFAFDVLIINFLIFAFIQMSFMGLPDSIVGRDLGILPRKFMWSLITIAPTTVSFVISVYFSFHQSVLLDFARNPNLTTTNWAIFWGLTLFAGIGTWMVRPRNIYSKNFRIPSSKPMFKRVVILNIDGCRLDVFKSLNLPHTTKIANEGTSFPNGLTTIYRALTNPAFASIMTGCPPEVHGIRDNNFGQDILVEGLPDKVKTRLYGSMHIKHFSKDEWDVEVISLPTHSIYNSDDEMMKVVREDLAKKDDTRLFVVDFSEGDFLGHAYGSTSKNYKDAITRIDQRIGDFFSWMESQGLAEDTGIIICSDHGMAEIDHSYLIRTPEKYVPCILWGKHIKQNLQIQESHSIMDITSTVAYMLGVPYPDHCRGRVFLEAFSNIDADEEKEKWVGKVNQSFYSAYSEDYVQEHPEIYDGDSSWWTDQFKGLLTNQFSGKKISVLDFGCGAGFVGHVFKEENLLDNVENFTLYDASQEILENAKSNLGDGPFTYCADFNAIKDQQFDVIAINSVLHHFYNPETILVELKKMLKPGGVILGAHEPNKDFFKNSLLATGLASLYKRLGGGKDIPPEKVERMNQFLSKEYGETVHYTAEEIHQIAEFHSPIEQSIKGIDRNVGFSKNIIQDFYKNFEVLYMDSYTSFFHRKGLNKYPLVKKILEVSFKTVFRGGNLIAYTVRSKS